MMTIMDSEEQRKSKLLFTPLSGSLSKRLVIGFWLASIGMGALQAWDARFRMTADGISYIDVADAYLRGDWAMAINGYWGPLYSWLIAFAMLVLKPSSYYEFQLVHLVNFVIYVFTLGCFHFFIKHLITYNRNRLGEVSQITRVIFPEWAWIVLGYSLFLHGSLIMIGVWEESPDMLVAAFVYLASGMILRIRMGMTHYGSYALLGAVLGFGYFAKAFMFPMAFVFLLVGSFSTGSLKKALPRIMLSFVIFLIIASPLITALSISRDRLTFGDAGSYSYWFWTNGYNFYHWDGEPPGSGTPMNPPRKIYDDPVIYEFGTPFNASYPLWYDPTYWNDGLETHFDLKEQLQAITRSIKTYYPIFYPKFAVVMFGSLVLFLMGRRRWLFFADIAKHYNLIVPAITALCLYALVSVDPRYVSPFVILLWLGILSGIVLPDSNDSRRLLKYLVVLMTLVMMIVTTRHFMKIDAPESHVHWHVADSLNKMGLEPGDKVASIGNSHAHFWARIAKVHIVAEIPYSEIPYKKDEGDFWNTGRAVKPEMFEAFRSTGAKIIVTNGVPAGITPSGWERIPNTDYYFYMLSK
jgi:hypothetical protein